MTFFQRAIALAFILLPSCVLAQVSVSVNPTNIDRKTVLDTGINHDYAVFQSDLKNYTGTNGNYLSLTGTGQTVTQMPLFQNGLIVSKIGGDSRGLFGQTGITGYNSLTNLLSLTSGNNGGVGFSTGNFLDNGYFLSSSAYTKLSKGLYVTDNFIGTGTIPSQNAALYFDTKNKGIRLPNLTTDQIAVISPTPNNGDLGLSLYQTDGQGYGEGVYVLNSANSWQKLATSTEITNLLGLKYVPYSGANNDIQLGNHYYYTNWGFLAGPNNGANSANFNQNCVLFNDANTSLQAIYGRNSFTIFEPTSSQKVEVSPSTSMTAKAYIVLPASSGTLPVIVSAPGSSSAPGATGQIAYDTNYFYWYAGGKWNRVARDSTF